MKEIIIAQQAGFCYGVKRAVEMVEKFLSDKQLPLYCLGSLIHNDQVVVMLEEKGLRTVRCLEEIPKNSTFVIRSHGIPPELISQVKERDINILDATCPFVKKAQITAKDLKKAGCQVVICGDPVHAEVVGINARINNEGIIIYDAMDVFKHKFKSPVGVMSQTTQKIELLKETVNALLDYGLKNLMIKNTICRDSAIKQTEIRILAPQVDIMIVIGGKSSSNTTKLAELSRKAGTKTYHIETAQELDAAWFEKVEKVGVSAGASTAKNIIGEVVNRIKKIR